MKSEFKNKRATISISMLIMMFILLASTAVILVLWYQFKWNQTVDADTCHTSLLLRHTANVGGGKALLLPVSIKCQTEKVCFVKSKSDDCSDYFSDSERVEKIVVSNRNSLLEQLALKRYECWDMLGRGYLDYRPIGLNLLTKTYCAPCSRFAFSDSIASDSQFSNLDYRELLAYEAVHNVPDDSLKMTYFSFLYNENIDYNLHKDEINSKINFLFDLTKQYVVVTTLDKAGTGKTVLGGTLGAVAYLGAAYLTGGGSIFVLAVLGVGGAGIGFYQTDTGANFLPSAIVLYERAVFEDNLKCEDVDFRS